MKRNHDNAQPFLLGVSGLDFGVLIGALLDYAVERDEAGDHDSATRAYDMVNRARYMQSFELDASRQALAALGLGFARGHGQG